MHPRGEPQCGVPTCPPKGSWLVPPASLLIFNPRRTFPETSASPCLVPLWDPQVGGDLFLRGVGPCPHLPESWASVSSSIGWGGECLSG